MGSKYFKSPKNSFAKTAMLHHQKKLIEQHYKFLKCKIEKNVLVCRGTISSPDYKHEYKVEIRCVYGLEPYVKIIEPTAIIPSVDIHVYDDHSLCLHYPPDMQWHARVPIYEYTIPWLVEWVVYYELYLLNGGKWEGPVSPVHFTESDKNMAADVES
jgi:hypothetical protein